MTQGFDEWMNKNHSGAFDMPHQRDAYEAGQQSRQAEIDELKNNLEFSENCVIDARHERDELQNRIDEALDMLEGKKGKVLFDDILETLKGKDGE